MSKAYKALEPYLERAMAYQTAQVLFEWDNETLAPREAGSYTSRVVGTLSDSYFHIITDPEFIKLVKECQKEQGLTEAEAAIVREAAEEVEQLEKIPAQDYRAFAELVSKSTRTWSEARENQDFEGFAPLLEKIVGYQKKFAGFRAKDGKKLYDVMLDTYEKGFNMENLDRFFSELKQELVPFLKKITDSKKEIDNSFLTGDYSEESQEKAARYFAEYMGFDFRKGVLAVSAHPFTTNLHNHDVRITTHYSNRLDSSLFSVIHEAGHGIYEQGIRDDLTQTLVGQGSSMGLHESQSRFFENIIGRNPAFWEPAYEKLQEFFPKQLKNVSADKFVKAINKVEPGMIRTEADELTYSIHVLIRYEIEKQLIEENLDVRELPLLWADKYEEYLGVRPQSVSKGVLQDIHWSQGSFGYFPSYALGSAFGAQMYAFMRKHMDFDGLLKKGDIGVIREYLKEHIHQYGKLKTSREILKEMTGEDFTPKYYIEYLKQKYGEIYGIE